MENNLKFIVYCTTNLANNKIYVGVHMTNPDVFDGYIGNGIYINRPSSYEHSKTKFQYAVKKYGIKNFKRSTIAIFDNEEDAYSLEISIVNEDFIKRPDVYNMTLGGTNGAYYLTCKEVFQYSESGEFITSYKSIREAALKNERAMISIQRAIKDKCKCKNFFWTLTKFDKLDLSKMKSYEGIHKIPVFQYSKTGEYDCCYESIKDAARVLGISDANINVAMKLGTICNNKYFSPIFEQQFSRANSERIESTEIHQYSLDGKYIASYENMAKAKKILGIKSNIYRAIKLGRTAGNFQWTFEKFPEIAPIKPKSGRARRIGKYDKDGNLIAEYKSLAECKRQNGSGLVHVLEGRDKSHKGYIYKYLD